MKKLSPKKVYFIFIIVFMSLNILNTYFLTVKHLNRYIEPFLHTFAGELNQFIGNFAILFLVILIVSLIFKKANSRMKALIIITLALNLLVFALGIFNLYYGTAFSKDALDLFKNPAGGLAIGIILETLIELFVYFRITVFMPFIALISLYFLSDRKALSALKFEFRLKRMLITVLSISSLLVVSVSSYFKLYQTSTPVESMSSTFAIQNLGVYPYYLGELMGINFDVNYEKLLEIKNDDDMVTAFEVYNKNKSSYKNFFDKKTYGNALMVQDAVTSLYIDPTLSTSNDLTGIFKDKNLVIVHLESFNQFLLDHPEIGKNLGFLKNLFNESFVFNNLYNNVGMGVSSDAELSILTGLNPIGDKTLYWDFDKMPYDLTSLVKYFNEIDYKTEVIHGDYQTFYNRDAVYPGLFEFDEFYALEDFIADGYSVEDGFLFDTVNNLVHHSPWVSDFYLADTVSKRGGLLADMNKPFFLFPITMMGHTPYEFDPYGGDRTTDFPQYANLIQKITLRYINYTKYYDEFIKRFFINEYGNDQTLDDTVYLFYSDHGSGIKNGDLSILFDRKLSSLEERRLLQQVSLFIYAPSNDTYVDYGDYQLRKGLLTGEQNLVRSQIDMYRTVIELFDLDIGNDMYFGVHGMSLEPTFALDNRLTDVVLDDYIYSMRNRYAIYPKEKEVSKEIYDYILRYKILSDYLLSTKDKQTIINGLIK